MKTLQMASGGTALNLVGRAIWDSDLELENGNRITLAAIDWLRDELGLNLRTLLANQGSAEESTTLELLRSGEFATCSAYERSVLDRMIAKPPADIKPLTRDEIGCALAVRELEQAREEGIITYWSPSCYADGLFNICLQTDAPQGCYHVPAGHGSDRTDTQLAALQAAVAKVAELRAARDREAQAAQQAAIDDLRTIREANERDAAARAAKAEAEDITEGEAELDRLQSEGVLLWRHTNHNRGYYIQQNDDLGISWNAAGATLLANGQAALRHAHQLEAEVIAACEVRIRGIADAGLIEHPTFPTAPCGNGHWYYMLRATSKVNGVPRYEEQFSGDHKLVAARAAALAAESLKPALPDAGSMTISECRGELRFAGYALYESDGVLSYIVNRVGHCGTRQLEVETALAFHRRALRQCREAEARLSAPQ